MVARCRRKPLLVVGLLFFFSWNMLVYFILTGRNSYQDLKNNLKHHIDELQLQLDKQLIESHDLLRNMQFLKNDQGGVQRNQSSSNLTLNAVSSQAVILPVLMIACDRPAITRSLDLLLKYRPDPTLFPVIVSQDCGHKETSAVIHSYIAEKNTSHFMHIKHTNLSDIKVPSADKKYVGYYKISRHYKWALSQVFNVFNYSAAIIVEDDLEYSPDFFEYFRATHRLLRTDSSLWCISAWNDNGKSSLVSEEADKLYRTDFFPGLGWMIQKELWDELRSKWPVAFWDDWMRVPEQRKGRQCIRPEICRTSTFGKKGVSNGMYYDKHLKYIRLNSDFVPFTNMDLSFLQKEQYDWSFRREVYRSPLVTVPEVISRAKPEQAKVRVQYSTRDELRKFSKQLGIMDDLMAGVPRAAYLGVISIMFQGRRVYLSPPENWNGYDTSWK